MQLQNEQTKNLVERPEKKEEPSSEYSVKSFFCSWDSLSEFPTCRDKNRRLRESWPSLHMSLHPKHEAAPSRAETSFFKVRKNDRSLA